MAFTGTTRAFDLRIPAAPEVAGLVGVPPLTKHNWFCLGNCIFTRIKSVTPIRPVPEVHDLKVEGDETYMTAAALAHNWGKRKGAVCRDRPPLGWWRPPVDARNGSTRPRASTSTSASRTEKKLDNLYKLAWMRGLKTTYYLRSMGATHLEKSTMEDAAKASQLNTVGGDYPSGKDNGSDEVQACSILDPKPECEACQ